MSEWKSEWKSLGRTGRPRGALAARARAVAIGDAAISPTTRRVRRAIVGAQ
jgi:hypothetical protein